MTESERLQKVLARAGVASRRTCEEMIRQGRVAVNGQVVTELGTKVSPQDAINVNGQPLPQGEGFMYIMLNKPAGYTSTVRDPHADHSVVELVPVSERLYPVGRLDKDSEGLLLLTNDGDFAQLLTHPRFEVDKQYDVLLDGAPSDSEVERLLQGLQIDNEWLYFHRVRFLCHSDQGAWLGVTLHQGRKRQIRRMFGWLGYHVLRLVRVEVGPVRLGELAPGQYRFLTDVEVKQLRAAATTAAPRPAVVAIDGPVASGKSALGAALAKRWDYLYLDTGALYRAVTWLASQEGININDEDALVQLVKENKIKVVPPTVEDGREFTVLVNGQDATWQVYRPEVDAKVSAVSAHRGVRSALLPLQRAIARHGQVVMVGRDIGSVVAPKAGLKVYLQASPEVRASRRYNQLMQRGLKMSYNKVLEEIKRRDELDQGRKVAPLKAASDALVIETDDTSLEQELAIIEGAARVAGRDRERATVG